MTAALCTAAMLFTSVPAMPAQAKSISGEVAGSQNKNLETRKGEVADDVMNQIFALYTKEGSDYETYKKSNEDYATFKEEHTDNAITIKITAKSEDYADSEGEFSFLLDGDYITFHYTYNKFVGYILFTYLQSAIAEYLDMDKELVNGYIQAIGGDKDNQYYQVIEDEESDDLDFKLYVGGTYDMDEVLNKTYLSKEYLEKRDARPLGRHETQFYNSIGKVKAHQLTE